MRETSIEPVGLFSLQESVEFGFGQRDAEPYAGFMRLAFVLDGTESQIGVVVRQPAGADGALTLEIQGEVSGEGDLDAVRGQVARVLSVDVDARPFGEVGQRDPHIGRLQRVAPGLRPPLFYSPYEAAVWAVLSARRPARQMAAVRERISADHGRVFDLAGRTVAALPGPASLLAIAEVPGLPADKLERMHGVAQAALDGLLDVHVLRGLEPAEASARVQQIKGIGPFYADLIVVRALGLTDVLPGNEPRLMGLVGELYGRGGPVTGPELVEIAEPWRPFRTWAAVLVRAASSRL